MYTSKKPFLERKNTSLANYKIDKQKAIDIIHYLDEGNGIRKTCRLTVACKDTVSRLSKIAGEHSASIHDKLATEFVVKDQRKIPLN